MTKIVAQSTLFIATFVIRYLNICYFRQECPVELTHVKRILQLSNLHIVLVSVKKKWKEFSFSCQLFLLLVLFLRKQCKITLSYLILKWNLNSGNVFREQTSQLFSSWSSLNIFISWELLDINMILKILFIVLILLLFSLFSFLLWPQNKK